MSGAILLAKTSPKRNTHIIMPSQLQLELNLIGIAVGAELSNVKKSQINTAAVSYAGSAYLFYLSPKYVGTPNGLAGREPGVQLGHTAHLLLGLLALTFQDWHGTVTK